MDPSTGLSRRDSLDAMNAAFILHAAVNTFTLNQCDDFLESTHARRTRRQDIDLPVQSLGIARIHSKNIGDEKPGFIAAGSGADFENDIPFIIGIPGQKEQL